MLIVAIRIGLAVLVLTAALYDLRCRRIPNWLNLSGVILGFGLNTLLLELSGMGKAGEGMLLALLVYFPLYLLRGMGAGDVKLMAAVGALVGPGNWFQIFIATALIGGGTAFIYALIKGRLRDTFCNLYFMLRDLACLRAPHRTNPELDFRNKRSLSLPHGVPIALGSFVFLICASTGNPLLSNLISQFLFRVF